MNLLQFSLSLEDFTRKLVTLLLFAPTTTHLKLYLIHTNKKQRVRDAGVSQRKWLAIEFLGKTNLNLNTLNPVFSYLPVDAENNKQERGENVTSSSNHHQNLAHHVAGIPLHQWWDFDSFDWQKMYFRETQFLVIPWFEFKIYRQAEKNSSSQIFFIEKCCLDCWSDSTDSS